MSRDTKTRRRLADSAIFCLHPPLKGALEVVHSLVLFLLHERNEQKKRLGGCFFGSFSSRRRNEHIKLQAVSRLTNARPLVACRSTMSLRLSKNHRDARTHRRLAVSAILIKMSSRVPRYQNDQGVGDFCDSLFKPLYM